MVLFSRLPMTKYIKRHKDSTYEIRILKPDVLVNGLLPPGGLIEVCEISIPPNEDYTHHVCEYHNEFFLVKVQ